jgi:hypothetical protein
VVPRPGATRRRAEWRLVGFSKSACPPAEIHVYSAGLRREYRECDEWRERTLERIAQKENPSLIVTSMLNRYRGAGGREGPPSGREQRSGRRGIRLHPRKAAKHWSPGRGDRRRSAPGQGHTRVRLALARSSARLRVCSSKAMGQPRINASAAAEVEGASLIDATPMVCPGKSCPAVIGDVLVYRNGAHSHGLTFAPSPLGSASSCPSRLVD